MRTTAELWLLWGKTGGDGTWHPALAHILDVGAVAEILTRHFAKRLAELLSLDEEVAARVAAFLIASHDIGKLFAGFQQKAVPFEGWILPPGLPRVPEARSVGFDHGLRPPDPGTGRVAGRTSYLLAETGFERSLSERTG